MRTLARELAPRIIRVNTTHPTGADNPMSNNGFVGTWLEENRELGDAMRGNLMPVSRCRCRCKTFPMLLPGWSQTRPSGWRARRCPSMPGLNSRNERSSH